MRLAIVGAGYAGLALAWHFSKRGFETTVFDGGEGASHASTGLLHSSPGKKAKPSLYAEEAIAATLELLKAASQKRPVFEENGILRIAVNEEQRTLFGGAHLWIPEGITVYSRLYLQELQKVCEKAQFVKERVTDRGALQDYDAVFLTMGAQLFDSVPLPLKRTLGQSLLCRWKEPLPYSLLAQGHITPTEDPEICQVGSTYEYTAEPDPNQALDLLKKIGSVYPAAQEFQVVDIRSAVRVSPKIGYQPLIQQIDAKTWVFTGLGSRGLLYHAFYAESFVNDWLAKRGVLGS